MGSHPTAEGWCRAVQTCLPPCHLADHPAFALALCCSCARGAVPRVHRRVQPWAAQQHRPDWRRPAQRRGARLQHRRVLRGVRAEEHHLQGLLVRPRAANGGLMRGRRRGGNVGGGGGGLGGQRAPRRLDSCQHPLPLRSLCPPPHRCSATSRGAPGTPSRRARACWPGSRPIPSPAVSVRAGGLWAAATALVHRPAPCTDRCQLTALRLLPCPATLAACGPLLPAIDLWGGDLWNGTVNGTDLPGCCAACAARLDCKVGGGGAGTATQPPRCSCCFHCRMPAGLLLRPTPQSHSPPFCPCPCPLQAFSYFGAGRRCYLKAAEGWTGRALGRMVSWMAPDINTPGGIKPTNAEEPEVALPLLPPPPSPPPPAPVSRECAGQPCCGGVCLLALLPA